MVDRGQFQQQVSIHFQEDNESVTINAPVRKKLMSESFDPTHWSLICGCGRDCYDHEGNRRLRVLVEERLDQYEATKNKFQKTLIVTSIIDTIREACDEGGAFVRKIGKMLREALIRKCPQKLEAKKRKRPEKARRSSANSTGNGSSAASAVAKRPPAERMSPRQKTLWRVTAW